AKDFYLNDKIRFNELDDHHIFPKKFLSSKGVEVLYDTVANRTLIFSETNKKISSKAPADYLKEMTQEYGTEERVKEILQDHFIDEEMYEILLNTSDDSSPEDVKKNFEAFVQKREELIKREIAELIGINS
ncbi:MAG: hypothetical protein C6H99_02885, partial [Epsilonproteobacteria bacterium]|nr:hypothetical protein [Campylobacterota bacterium]NPA63336.1 hypothetical protein [Campylobacterota bacterium]